MDVIDISCNKSARLCHKYRNLFLLRFVSNKISLADFMKYEIVKRCQ